MALPAGVTTATVTFGQAVSFTGKPTKLSVSIKATHTVVHAATGTTLTPFKEVFDTQAGNPGSIELPHVDQEGFVDSAGNDFTGWAYIAEGSYELDGSRLPFKKVFQVLEGQTEVDLDLIPDGVIADPVSAPLPAVLSVNGQTGNVIVEGGTGGGAVDSVNGQVGVVSLTKADVGLGNVDNTTDDNKPISWRTQEALDLKAPLDSPAFTGTPTGITKVHVGLGNVDNTSDTQKPVSAATQNALNLKAPLNSPAFTGTPTGITKVHVGLSNVDNTSDANKPISTATQNALNLKAADASVVHNTGAETIGGVKTFSSAPVVPVGAFAIDRINGLQAILDNKIETDAEIAAGELLDELSSTTGLITGRRLVAAIDALVGVQAIRWTGTTWNDVPRTTAKVRLFFSQNDPDAPAPLGMDRWDLWFQSPEA